MSKTIKVSDKLKQELDNHCPKQQTYGQFIEELLFHWKDCTNA